MDIKDILEFESISNKSRVEIILPLIEIILIYRFNNTK